MAPATRDEHLFSPGPKRILALDGGGIRGILSLQFLKLLEERLRERHRRGDSFRLCWPTYLRYEAWLEAGWLQETLGRTFPPEQIRSLREMDDAGNLETLAEIGEGAARQLLDDAHVPASFDLKEVAP